MNIFFTLTLQTFIRFIVFFLVLSLNYAYSQSTFSFKTFDQDSLEQVAQTADSRIERTKSWTYLCAICGEDETCEDSLAIAYLAKLKTENISFSDTERHYLKIAEGLVAFLQTDVQNSNPQDSIEQVLKNAYESAEAIEEADLLYEAFQNLREFYVKNRRDKQDMELIQKFLLRIEAGHKVSPYTQQRLFFNMAIYYSSRSMQELSDQYLYKAYEIGVNSSQTVMRIIAAESIFELGILSEDTLDILEAKDILERIDISQITANEKWEVKTLLGRIQTHRGQYAEALRLLEEVERMSDSTTFDIPKNKQIYNKMNVADLLFAQEKYEELEKISAELFTLLDTSNLSELLKTQYLLMEGYAAQEDFSSYYSENAKFLDLMDKFQARSIHEKVAEASINFETEIKKIQIEKLELERAIILKQRNYLILGFCMIGLFLGLVFYLLYMLRRQNQIIRLEKQIVEDKNKKLREIEEQKNSFFINASHELRTPLTLIKGPVQNLLRKDYFEESDKQMLEIIASQSKGMKEQLDQILLLDKGEQFISENLQIESITLEALLQEFFPAMLRIAEHRGIQLAIEPKNLSKLQIEVDKMRLQTVLKNILSNALKFTPKGGNILFEVNLTESILSFTISDTGRGIPAASLPYVFERFYQVPTKNQEGGTGIGLAICKSYMRQMGGDITASSKEGEGSIFYVELPCNFQELKSSAQAPLAFTQILPQKAEPVVQEGTSNKPLILIVEDNLDMAVYLENILQEEFQIHKSKHGNEALNFLSEGNNPHLILSDVMMPEMDGWTLIEKLQNHKVWQKIPVIILTAKNDIKDKLSFLRMGVNDYLTKPFIEDELLARIDNLLANADSREKSQQAHNQGIKKGTEDPLNELDMQWLQKLNQTIEPLLPSFDLSLEQVASEMAVSLTHLNRKIKIFTGMTPMQFIQNLRFEKARQLLESDPNIPIKVVSYSVGFKSEKHFSRNFKKRFGVSPSEYRRS